MAWYDPLQKAATVLNPITAVADVTNKDGVIRSGLRDLDPTTMQKADTSGISSAARQSKEMQPMLLAKAMEAGRMQAPQAQAQQINRAGIDNVFGGTVAGSMPQMQAAQIDQSQAAQARAAQEQALAMQQQAAMGQAPSVAQELLRQGIGQSAQQSMALAGARGGFNPAAVRQAQQAQAQVGQQVAAQTGALRAQEMADARMQMAQQAAQIRSQDMEVATAAAQLEQEARQFNASQEGQALLADADRAMNARLANQGVDLDVLKSNAAMGNEIAMQNLQSELSTMGMSLDAQIAYLSAALGIDAGILSTQLAMYEIEQGRYLESGELRSRLIAGGLSSTGTAMTESGTAGKAVTSAAGGA
jgi:hypothetical protein